MLRGEGEREGCMLCAHGVGRGREARTRSRLGARGGRALRRDTIDSGRSPGVRVGSVGAIILARGRGPPDAVVQPHPDREGDATASSWVLAAGAPAGTTVEAGGAARLGQGAPPGAAVTGGIGELCPDRPEAPAPYAQDRLLA